ncbi:hypothetical protein A2533_01915 [Candidatus Falkowbacteria bacterium RIFOXYD2_FULL_35_9]|uniref:Uncharacterized protein n=1 Tax=Candidatus Falkowbacteria bacterium RIFOXYC2_FULL_36_12 TaxID=1798002 RepID=A0A1F5SYT0_9BACT|nr:MAG: hypothetical protein A2300_01605 [Candidatus Falkowbacteria bacterium RIFOXYB2_FULL_35_7]OGF31802.1 MAG: hypothetical protein A2478_04945 [Candidatus Falkowbacteria bacterium RIFOXYC2_FULL_36_12]OGF33788.1 MAG: hypothetical protein A2223_00245 [Candidatus Falkowbacteria bacterium RIFOXYA2_FULL_35_8]OGF48259.1 MAG: hypothetical protein A2533_01915 [Candidatus Falkowbacteria bacterium RIFOXYD2_FULL_35_9]
MFNNSDQLKIISNCPVCNSQNFPAQIKVLNENQDSHLLYVQCRKCKSRVLVLITSNQNGISSLGLLTDLSSEEVVKFSQSKPVSTDDVLDLYQTIQTDENTLFNLV